MGAARPDPHPEEATVLLEAVLLFFGSCYGSGGASAPANVLPAGDRDTLPLVANEVMVFVGLTGDFSGENELRLREYLSRELGLRVVGSPVRSLADKGRQVWAVRTTDPEGLAKEVAGPLKQRGYQATPVRATVMVLLGRPSSGEVQRVLRDLDRQEKKVWASHFDAQEGVVWTFHEPRISAEKLMDEVRRREIKAAFHHQELELAAKEAADLPALAKQAEQNLDLVKAGSRDQALVLDLYLRNVETLLALERGRRVVACPDVLSFLGSVPAGKLSWSVTLENRGYPFVE